MTADSFRRRAIAALIMVNLLWGISFPVMKMINARMGRASSQASASTSAAAPKTLQHMTAASFLMVVRFAISLGLLAGLMPDLFRGMTLSQWLMGAATGLAFSVGMILQNMALNEIPASRSGFLTSLSVVFTPLLMIAVERRLPRWSVVIGAVIALAGTAVLVKMCRLETAIGVRIVASWDARIGWGDWLTILAAFTFAVQIITVDVCSQRMPPAKLTPGMFLCTWLIAACVFPVAFALGPPAQRLSEWSGLLVDLPFLSLTLVLSLLCSVLAFHWMNKYQAHVSPAHASLIYTLEPIFATLWAMVLPGWISPLLSLDYPSERPGWELVLGGSLVVGGNVLALWPPRRAESEAAAATT